MRGRKRGAGQTPRARSLRRRETDAEHRLWSSIRNRQLGGHKFVRQFPIGAYRELMLAVKVDGGQHSEAVRDLVRDRFINAAGYGVLRYWNTDVLDNLNGVLRTLLLVLEGRPSSGLRYAPATLSRRAGEGKIGGATGPASLLPPAGEGGA